MRYLGCSLHGSSWPFENFSILSNSDRQLDENFPYGFKAALTGRVSRRAHPAGALASAVQ